VPVRSASGNYTLYFDDGFFDGKHSTPMSAMTAFVLNMAGRKIFGYDLRLEECRDFAALDRMNEALAQSA